MQNRTKLQSFKVDTVGACPLEEAAAAANKRCDSGLVAAMQKRNYTLTRTEGKRTGGAFNEVCHEESGHSAANRRVDVEANRDPVLDGTRVNAGHRPGKNDR